MTKNKKSFPETQDFIMPHLLNPTELQVNVFYKKIETALFAWIEHFVGKKAYKQLEQSKNPSDIKIEVFQVDADTGKVVLPLWIDGKSEWETDMIHLVTKDGNLVSAMEQKQVISAAGFPKVQLTLLYPKRNDSGEDIKWSRQKPK